MTRYTLWQFMLVGSLAASSISCGGLVPTANEPPVPHSELTAQSEATQPTNADTSTSVTEPADKKVDAEAVLKNALARATAEDKAVLVHLGAPW